MSALVDRLVAQVLALEVKLMACHARLIAETDSEALHDLRITVRRLRSLLRPLRDLPGVEQLEAAAQGVGQQTTPLRDREVLAAWLDQQGMTHAAQKRSDSLSKAYATVATSPALVQLFNVLEAFPRFVRASQHQKLLRGLHTRIEKRLDKQWKNLKAAMNDPEHDRHRLRLLIKRVRYAAETYPDFSRSSKKIQAHLKAAQSELGDWHDHFQWLAQAEQEHDLTPCVAGWRLGILRAERKADVALERLGKVCFGR
jgi:CHAD domain-containing protein